MANDLVLYSNPMSRGRIAHCMLEEIGEPYSVEMLEFGTAMKNAAFRSINPMGKVPVLRHGEQVVTECAAICAYLAAAFPARGLMPLDHERADWFRWLFFAAGPLEAAVTNRALKLEISPERSGMLGYGSFEDVMDTLEIAVSRYDFIAGDRFTAADVYVGSQIGWGLRFGSIDKREAFVAYWDRLRGRDALARADRFNEAAMKGKSA